MDPLVSPVTAARSCRLGLLLLLATAFVGCPVKKEKIVEKIVEKEVATPVATKPTASVKDMVMVARVKVGDGEKAVLASGQDFAALVGVGEPIGTEGGSVTGIAANGATVRLPDTTSILIRKSDTVPQAGGAGEPGTPGGVVSADQALSDAELAKLKELEQWRGSVVSYVTSGYGVPADVLLALAVAGMPHRPPTVGEALNKLGWQAAAGIDAVGLTRVTIEGGKISAAGNAPNKAAFDAYLKRLKDAGPLLKSAKMLSLEPAGGGFNFELSIDAPLVGADDVAISGNASGPKPLPDDMRDRLTKAAAKLPTSAAVAGFDADLKNLASSSGLTVQSVARQPKSVEEGFLGMVSFKLQATGSTQALIALLSSLRRNGATEGPPVVVDPLIVPGNTIAATVRVPYVAGKADARAPAPSPIFLPSLNSPRWRPVRAIPPASLRDPLKR